MKLQGTPKPLWESHFVSGWRLALAQAVARGRGGGTLTSHLHFFLKGELGIEKLGFGAGGLKDTWQFPSKLTGWMGISQFGTEERATLFKHEQHQFQLVIVC